MEKLIAGMRMSINEVNVPTLEEFVRIHQLQPFYQVMTDVKKKAFLKELRAAYKELKK
jgi:hypothetical protein